MKTWMFRFAIFISLLFSSATFAQTAISVMPNAKLSPALSSEIANIVKKNVDLSGDIQKAKVQVIYKDNKPSYLLVYLLSSKNYSLTITKIELNAKFKSTSVIKNYRLQKQDLQQQPKKFSACPNEAVNFVSGTPADEIPTAKAVIEQVTTMATENGYTAAKMLGDEASVENYIGWLSCPNLKGFYNVGHGNDSGILLADGFLSHEVFKTELNAKLAARTVVLFNSCEVVNDPLKSSITEDANAQKYAGGITTLWIGPSEKASQCFWAEAFKHQEMSPALAYCAEKHDPTDVWGIEGHGADVLNNP